MYITAILVNEVYLYSIIELQKSKSYNAATYFEHRTCLNQTKTQECFIKVHHLRFNEAITCPRGEYMRVLFVNLKEGLMERSIVPRPKFQPILVNTLC